MGRHRPSHWRRGAVVYRSPSGQVLGCGRKEIDRDALNGSPSQPQKPQTLQALVQSSPAQTPIEFLRPQPTSAPAILVAKPYNELGFTGTRDFPAERTQIADYLIDETKPFYLVISMSPAEGAIPGILTFDSESYPRKIALSVTLAGKEDPRLEGNTLTLQNVVSGRVYLPFKLESGVYLDVLSASDKPVHVRGTSRQAGRILLNAGDVKIKPKGSVNAMNVSSRFDEYAKAGAFREGELWLGVKNGAAGTVEILREPEYSRPRPTFGW